MKKTSDPGKRADGNYVVSWVRPYGKGRVFYCSLGHEASSYHNSVVLQHYLAGIQFALKHRLQAVRGRAVLDCLARAAEPWARTALEKGAPHALAFRAND